MPRKLQGKIFRSVLAHDRPLAPNNCRYHYLPGIYGRIPAETDIFLVSQQIYDEAREIFLDENVFEYEESYDLTTRGPSYVTYKIPRKEQQRSIDGVDAIKNARNTRAMFGDRNDMIADFINLLVQNQRLRSLELRFHNMTVSLLIACQAVLPELEAVKVRDSVVFDFLPRCRTRLGAQIITKREREFEMYLEVLEKKMLTK